MLRSLYKYLVLHRHAGIPGVGSFSILQSPATIDAASILPPKYSIGFVPGTALADKQFYQFLSSETGISEVDAVRKFQDFAYQLRKDIQSHPQVLLKGLGLLKKNPSGDISFESSASLDHYFATLALPQPTKAPAPVTTITPATALHTNGEDVTVEETVQRKDRWWIWAILLTLAAVAVIVYFATQGNIL